jgi:hypothetical protein
MAIILDGTAGITFPSGSVQNNAVANTAAITAILGSRGLPTSVSPAGSILQVVQGVKTDTYTTTSTSYVAITSLAASITPTSSSSKILITASINIGVASDTYHAYFQLWKNGSNLSGTTGTSGQPWPCFMHQNGTNYRNMYALSMSYLDSPATTSSTTYAIYGANQTSSSGFTINYCNLSDSWTPGGISTITLFEIAQ